MSETQQPVQINFDRMQRIALTVGVIGLALGVLGAIIDLNQLIQAYLVGYIFWFGISLGCLAIALAYYLSGGMWGRVILRFAEAGAKTLPMMVMLFIPIVVGLNQLYPWAQPEIVANDALLQHKNGYLNVPFFLIRAVAFFAIWIAIAALVTHWSLAQDRSRDVQRADRLRRFGALGLVIVGLTATFAMTDWLMSLEPHWYSTIYAAMVVMGQVLAAFAFVIVLITAFSKHKPFSEIVSPQLFNDLGNLLMAAVMMWAYLAFSQFLIMWSGNLPEEIIWYVRRTQGGWEYIALFVAVANYALPFLLLLSRDLKRNSRSLGWIALEIFFAQLVNTFWLIAPAFTSSGLAIHWLDFVLPIGLGGIWITMFVWQLKRHPVLPAHDVRSPAPLEADHAQV